MMLSDAIDEYLVVRKRQVGKVTLKNEHYALKQFLAEVGNIQLKNLKSSHIETFLFDEQREELEASSFNNVLKYIRGFLNWCDRRGYVRRNLLEEIRNKKIIKRERMRLSPNQLLNLLDLADSPRDRVLLALAMNTGMRAGDLTELKIEDVDLENGILYTKISKSGLEDPKPISADLDKELRRWLLAYEAERKSTYRQTLQSDWYLVPKMIRSHLLNGRTERKWFIRIYPDVQLQGPWRIVKRILAKVGLDGPGEGIHTIRRSVARAYFESLRAQGYDGALQATKAFLNHADTKVTELYLGLAHERVVRDETIRGQPFLSGMVTEEGVVNIRDFRKEA